MPNSRYHYTVRLPLIFLCGSLVLVGIFSKRGWLDWDRIREQNLRLGERLAVARAKKSDLVRRSGPLQQDRQALQSAVRQYLGYIRTDEIVIDLP